MFTAIAPAVATAALRAATATFMRSFIRHASGTTLWGRHWGCGHEVGRPRRASPIVQWAGRADIPSSLWEMYVCWVTKRLTPPVRGIYVARMNRSKRLTRRRFVDFLRVCSCTC
ncbi:hypothetical protein GCM10020358_70490 [Amorphoplanes nipponensis]|uniref:Uncharacterized protein n=1 Tax=Actinoplanes nipponensis TaxID=135950 RepID=A0A919JAJ8_9ACTN|nr:hypothetical protein Ani05nite_03000 [Actinoplanes nipponensis]